MTEMVLPPLLAIMDNVPSAYYLAPIGGLLALVMAKVFSGQVMKTSEGDDEMVRIAEDAGMYVRATHPRPMR